MYLVRIKTDAYKNRRCSAKNWEPSTMNDYMKAINGWHTTEEDLLRVRWRIMMFHGVNWVSEEYDANSQNAHGMSDRYTEWLNHECNKVVYTDRLCNCERQQVPSGYGIMQGYFSIDEKIKELVENGYVRIYFRDLYDTRQYCNNMDGCYMEICDAETGWLQY